MRNKKSVLMTGIVNYGCFNGALSAIAGNGWQLYEVKVATTKLQYLQELSATFILYRCCYVSGLNKKKKGGGNVFKKFYFKML